MLSPARQLLALRSRLRLTHPQRWCRHSSSGRASDPLRILFCGSDDFSCASLRALDEERRRAGGVVESIDVVVRPGKGTGRGHKILREVPLKNVATELQLPIHEKDTFTGFEPPSYVNLVVAVSFGLFVPPRILRASKYGGLNVHPSFLPDLRGGAPLHHALLQHRSHVGITLQTLDEHKFDHGAILAQTPRPGIPIPENCTIPQLVELVAKPGAELLVDGLRRDLHVPPIVDILSTTHQEGEEGIQHAHKLTKQDRRIDWLGWENWDIATRVRVLGPVWSEVVNKKSGGVDRVLFRDAEKVTMEAKAEAPKEARVVEWVCGEGEEGEEGEWASVAVPYVENEDGSVVFAGGIRVSKMLVGGKAVQPAARVMRSYS